MMDRNRQSLLESKSIAVACRLMLACGVASVILATVMSPARGFAQENEKARSREIELPELEEDELVRIQLDVSVFEHSQDDYADLRVLDSNELEVPYVIRHGWHAEKRTHLKELKTKNLDVLAPPAKELSVGVVLEENQAIPNRLEIETSLVDFEQQVQVSTSPDGVAWTTLVEAAEIYDYSRFIDVRKVSIDLPLTENRHFRIDFSRLTSDRESNLSKIQRTFEGDQEMERVEETVLNRRPFNIDKLRFLSEVDEYQAKELARQNYSLDPGTIKRTERESESHIEFFARNVPLTELKLSSKATNFSRRVILERQEDPFESDHWIKVTEKTISKIDFKSLQSDDLTIEFPAMRASKYRTRILNGDSPPLEEVELESSGNVVYVMFLAKPDQQYELLYSISNASAPKYDTAALETLIEKGFEPLDATLKDSVVEKTHFEDEANAWSFINDGRVIAGVVIGLVVLLGIVLFATSRKLANAADKVAK